MEKGRENQLLFKNHFQKFQLSVKDRRHLLSLSESSCLKMAQNFPAEFTQTAKNFMLRVTPNAVRYGYLLFTTQQIHRGFHTESSSDLPDSQLVSSIGLKALVVA